MKEGGLQRALLLPTVPAAAAAATSPPPYHTVHPPDISAIVGICSHWLPVRSPP